MNSAACHRSLQVLRNVSYRHARTIPSHLLRKVHDPTILSHSFSSKTAIPYLFPTVEGLHICKKRRYSSHALSHFPHDENRWVEDNQQGEATAVDASSARRHGGREDSGSQGGDGGIVITSNKRNLRDKQGRPWTQSTLAGQGKDARAVGVGVGISTAPKKRRKPRIELRDLAVKPKRKNLEPWQVQKSALQNKFGDDGWSPRKRVSPDAMEGIRALHEEDSERWSTPVLAEHFKISPEAIRRILKSKWKPKNDVETQKRRERWARRHDRIWDHQAELGLRPPRQRDREVEDPDAFDEELRAKEMLDVARRA